MQMMIQYILFLLPLKNKSPQMLNLRNKNDNMAFGLNEICSYLLDVLAFRNYVEIR